MSEASHAVEVVPVYLHPCPGSDNLSLVRIGGFQVVVRTEDWKDKECGAYVPPDSLVNTALPQFSFLASKAYADGYARVRAQKIRGNISMGLLVPAPEAAVVGDDVTHVLQVLHYQPHEPVAHGPKREGLPEGACEGPARNLRWGKYDLENARKAKFAVTLPADGVGEVIVTEKIHGENARYVWDGTTFHAGSRNNWWKPGSRWHKPLNIDRIEALCRRLPGYTVYGELHGATGGFPYDAPPGHTFVRVFDILDPAGNWLPYDAVVQLCALPLVATCPLLYRGPMDMEKVLALADGRSLLNSSHIREGCVVQTPETNRVKLKVHGAGFLALKEGVDPAAPAE